MNRIGWLFEHPLWLYAVCVAVAVVAVLAWLVSRRRMWARVVVVSAAVATVVAVVSVAVKTDREKITSALKDIAAKAQEQDFAGIGPHLDESVGLEGARGVTLDKRQILAMGQSSAQAFHVKMVHVRGILTTIDGDAARTELDVYVLYEGGAQFMKWKVEWGRKAGRWRIVAIELLKPLGLRELLQ